ncbi:hypothetical protein [Candidatus Poriferisodalis sp.]|uniref:hypothetical protein n=1 Tax=Candidatus Poriferisodalis sp. TaxID=3101277 RepID=UPI003B018168
MARREILGGSTARRRRIKRRRQLDAPPVGATGDLPEHPGLRAAKRWPKGGAQGEIENSADAARAEYDR